MIARSFTKRPLAHRGLWDEDYPENSMGAFVAAANEGYGIELDLQLSADGQAMVFHDDRLERLTEYEGWVNEVDASDLQRITLGGTNETIPTLAEVLAMVDGRVPVLIELKDQTAVPRVKPGKLEAAVAHDLKGYEGPAAVMSFNPEMVIKLAALAPDVPRGLTSMRFDPEEVGEEVAQALNDLAAFDVAGCSFVSHNWRDLSMPAIARLKEKRVPILCWTVRGTIEDRFARKVADNITFEGFFPE